MDVHWRPQSHIVAPRIVPYDFIGTMESFERDLPHILPSIFHVEVPLSVHRPHRTDAIERMAEYTPEATALVRRIYESDFAELGYSTDPDRLERQRPVARAAREPLRHWGAGLRQLRSGDCARAAGELEQASRWLRSPLIGQRLVTCYLHLAQVRKPAEPELALADLARITDLATGNPRLADWAEQHGLAAILRVVERHEKARPDEAVQLMAQVVALWSSDHRVWKRYGGALAAAGRDEEALEALIRGMVVLGPGRRRRRQRLIRLRRSLAFLRARQRRRKDALAALQLGQMPEAGRRSESLRPLSAFWEILNRTAVHVTASAAILIPAQASMAGGSPRADGASRSGTS